MPRPRSLDHASIGEAALRFVDREGLNAMSMRTVASDLGVGTMSLYRYVSGREEVERLIVDRIFLSVDASVSPRASWRRQVRELSEALRSAVADHSAAIPLLLVHFQHSSSAWQWLESLLRALTRAGFTAKQRVVAVRCLQAYVVGALQGEFLAPLDGAGSGALAGLSPDEYPLIVETAQAATSVTPDQEFGQGLTLLLEGLAASLPKTAN
jgi:AcrR family transcriptional regulator